jgi:hypothetical protein
LAIFEKADFFIQAGFKGAAFGDSASFKGATFANWARFEGAAFGDYVSFEGASFANSARFDGAVFGDWASFKSATLWHAASFDSATFGHYANFKGVTFGESIWFDGAAFGDGTNFDDTFFNGEVKLTGNSKWITDFELVTREFSSNVRMALKKKHDLSRRRKRSGPALFRAISFARARFDGEADFSGRNFERTADFTNACFCYPPNFDAIEGAARIDFTGANVGFVSPGKRQWTEDTKIPVRLRALRKIAEETKNHDFERDLYITERKAERGVYLHQQREDLKNDGWRHRPRNLLRLMLQGFWVFIMLLYRALSNYGRNPVLPFVWLLLSVPFFYWRYSKVLAPLMHDAGPANVDKYNHAIWMLAFGNAVPFVGPLTIDAEIKKFLFCPGFF